MCNQAALTAKLERLIEHYDSKYHVPLLYKRRYQIKGFKRDNMFIIPMVDPQSIVPAIWSFVPEHIYNNTEYFERTFGDVYGFWKKYTTLNAKSENVFNSNFYKNTILHQRCLIICDGFIEPHHRGKEKIPYFCYIPDEEHERKIFSFAGIYSKLDDELYSCTIITVPADEFFSEIHNKRKRMPLVLDPEFEFEWLRPDLKKEGIKSIMKNGFIQEEFKAHPISSEIYSKDDHSENPSIIAPIEINPTLF